MHNRSESQNEPFTVKGHWWLPNVKERVAGELRYTESDLTLSLYGGLKPAIAKSPFSAQPEPSEHELIYGESEDNRRYTVVGAFYTKWRADIHDLSVRPGDSVRLRTSELHCHKLLEGIHLTETTDAFSKCRVEVPSIEAWLGVSPFALELKRESKQMRLSYALPEDEMVEVESYRCRVGFIHAGRPPSLPLDLSPTIHHRTFFDIEFFEPQCLSKILNYGTDIVELLSVAYGGPLLSRRTGVYRPSCDKPLPVFYPRHVVAPLDYSTHDFLMRYETIRTQFSAVLSDWFSSNANLKRARRMLLSSERRPAEFIELRFLILAQAAEVLSNEAPRTTIVPLEKFRCVRKEMLDAISAGTPPELEKSIKEKLQWANGCSFREKLLSLISELDQRTIALFALDVERFISGIVKSRNHYTHYSTKIGRKVLQGRELHWATRKLALMIRTVILTKMGVSECELRDAFGGNVRLVQERRAWSSIDEEGTPYRGLETE